MRFHKLSTRRNCFISVDRIVIGFPNLLQINKIFSNEICVFFLSMDISPKNVWFQLKLIFSAFQVYKIQLINNSTPLLIPNQHLRYIPSNHTVTFFSEKVSVYLHTLVFLTAFLTYRTEYRKDQKSHHLIQVGHLDKSI